MTRRPPLPPEHIGWDLVRAARGWEADFIAAVVARGHPWFATARGRLLEHLPRRGLSQAELVRRTGLSKQAVQQLVDGLEADGIVAREPSGEDHRKKVILFTDQGVVALADIDEAKAAVEADMAKALGEDTLEALRAGLKAYIAYRQDT